MRTLILIVFITVCWSEVALSQWRKIAQLTSPITSIYFIDGQSSIGFVATENATQPNERLWRTMDGGITWQMITIPTYSGPRYPIGSSSILFKDKLEGWFCDAIHSSVPIYRTIDGGLTWSALSEKCAFGFGYAPATNRLICTGYPTYRFSTDGINFTSVNMPPIDIDGTVGIVFSDDSQGIMTAIFDQKWNSLYTNDGGLTWHLSNLAAEQFQPIGIPNTKTFFAISEREFNGSSGKVHRSDDGGITWREIYKYKDQTPFQCTGAMQFGRNQTLFFQTTAISSEGIMMSEDTGATFNSICGPANRHDTRFFVQDTLIYAADGFGGLWLNITGLGSIATPVLSQSRLDFGNSLCSDYEQTVTFTLFDSCSNKQAQLLDVAIEGTTDFIIVRGGESRTIKPNDSLVVRYVSSGPK